MIGRSAVEFLYVEDLAAHPPAHAPWSRRGARQGHFETRYVHQDGHLVPLAWTGVWSDAAQQHFFIGRDMTEQKRAEEQLSGSRCRASRRSSTPP